MMNSVHLIGFLQKKISSKETKIGSYVSTFILKIRNKKMSKESISYSYVMCVAFNKSAKIIEDYAELGVMLQVMGSIHEVVKQIKGVRIRTFMVLCDKVSVYSEIGASSDLTSDFIIDDAKHPLELNGNASNFNENDK